MAYSQPSSSNKEHLEDEIVRLCSEAPKGILSSELIKMIPGLSAPKFVELVNKLSKGGKLEGFKLDGKIAYRTKYKPMSNVNSKIQNRISLTDENEILIYKTIERFGSKGLTPQDLKPIVKLTIPTIKKILGLLEKKAYVKSYVPVYSSEKASSIKVYVSTAFVPDTTVTGGSLYQNMEIQEDYVEGIMAEIFAYLNKKISNDVPSIEELYACRSHALASSKEIFEYVKNLPASRQGFKFDELEKILGNMVYEGKIIRQDITLGPKLVEKWYKANFQDDETIIIGPSVLPCTYCKIFDDCTLTGRINSVSCEYFKQWLHM